MKRMRARRRVSRAHLPSLLSLMLSGSMHLSNGAHAHPRTPLVKCARTACDPPPMRRHRMFSMTPSSTLSRLMPLKDSLRFTETERRTGGRKTLAAPACPRAENRSGPRSRTRNTHRSFNALPRQASTHEIREKIRQQRPTRRGERRRTPLHLCGRALTHDSAQTGGRNSRPSPFAASTGGEPPPP